MLFQGSLFLWINPIFLKSATLHLPTIIQPSSWSELGTTHISCEVSWLLVLLIPILMFIIMFTSCGVQHQLTLPFPS